MDMRPACGSFMVNEQGDVVALPPPHGVSVPLSLHVPAHVTAPIGLTQIGELLLVDVRVARAVPPRSKLYKLCHALTAQHMTGVVEGTFVIDLQDAKPADSRFLRNLSNWPMVS